MYSYHPKTGKLFAVFLTLSGAITLNAGETATSVQRTDGYFIESVDGSADVSIVGNEIRLKSKDNIGKGYIFTVSADGEPSTVETGSETETESDATSGSETSDETVNGSGLAHTNWVEYYSAGGSSNSVSSKKRTKAMTSQQSGSTQTWQQVAKRTQAQKTAGIAGGEGCQMIFGIAYAPSNPNIAYFVTDTSQVWKSENADTENPYDITWHLKSNGFGASGGVSVVVHPTNADIAYVAGGNENAGAWTPFPDVVQGIFRTTDGGDNWTLVKSTGFARDGRGGVHFAFAGSNMYAIPSNTGVLKSTDNGVTWNYLLTSGGAKILNSLTLKNIVVHPTDNTKLFVSTSDGLYKIEDSGGSATVNRLAQATLPSGTVFQLAIDPNTPDTMYICAAANGVWKSINGGSSFSRILVSPTDSDGNVGRAQHIAMSPVNASRLIVSFAGLFGRYVYHSSDGGANWTQTANMDESNADGWIAGSTFGMTTNQSGVDSSSAPISFHPTNQNTALTIGWMNQIKKTTDGGVSWKYANTGYTGMGGGDHESSSAIGWDSTNYNRAAYAHADVGTYITKNNEDTFESIGSVKHNDRQATTAVTMRGEIIVESVGQSNDSNFLQVVAISRDSGTNWTKITNATSLFFKLIQFHPQNNNIVYADKYKFTNIQTNKVCGCRI